METKVGVVGLGYWGKILLKSLPDSTLTYDSSPDKQGTCKTLLELNECTHIFIATNIVSHHRLCQYFLKQGKAVFCEKPLTIDIRASYNLFELAKKNRGYLFVDWTFLFNPQVWELKRMIDYEQYGKLRSVHMNRLNWGPVRTDCSAKWDLAVHDVSILNYLLGIPTGVQWIEYNRHVESKEYDSCIGLLRYGPTIAQIDVSWYYGRKNRECIFEFEDGFVFWDDVQQKLVAKGEEIQVNNQRPPLNNAISAFMDQSYSQAEIQLINTNIEGVMHR
jgi:predicted dehydrogenase